MRSVNESRALFIWIIFLSSDTIVQRCEQTTPVYTWPLDARYGNAEVVQGFASNQSACASGNTGAASGHPDLGYDAVSFSGAVDSYLDLFVLNSDALSSDFTFILFLNSTDPTSGTIFHYKTSVSSSDSLAACEIIMSVNSTHTTINVLGVNAEDYGTVSIVNVFMMAKKLLIEDWVPLSVHHDYSSGEIEIKLDAQTMFKADKDFLDRVSLAQPGTLRLGGRQDDRPDPFTGKITCVHLYDTKFSDFQQALASCQSSNWPMQPSTTVSPSSSCVDKKGYFVLSGRDKIPGQEALPVSPVVTSTVTSSRQCADLCLSTDGCTSFASNKGAHSCLLYNGVYSACLQGAIGTNYYVKHNIYC